MGLYSDLSFNNGQYIPQYAGLPLDQIKDTADVLSTRHYQNLATASQLEILANQYKSKLLPGAKSYVDEHISSIDAALQEMAAKGGENSTARINALATALQGDEGILTGLQQAERVNKELELEQTLLSQGKQPLRKPGVREAIMGASIRDPETGEISSLYKNPYMSTVEPYEDPVPHMENIWKTINPDSIESAIRAAGDTTIQKLLPQAYVNGQLDLPLFFESISRAGISQGKIDKLLDSAWSSYKLTPAYKQQKGVLGKSDSELKGEFYNQGLLRTFTNIQRDYKPTPAWAGNEGGGSGKQPNFQRPTQAPAQVVESEIPYLPNGQDASKVKVITGTAPVMRIKDGKVTYDIESARREPEEATIHPQYTKDLATAQEVFGPGAKITDYTDLIKQRTSNPWVMPFSADQITDMEKEIQRQFYLREYMDPVTGKVIQAQDQNGAMTDEFKELTGGNPEDFKVESVYDPKNHYTAGPASNEKFVKPVALISTDKDGKTRRFLASQPAGGFYTNPVETNTNKIYTTVNTRPGQMVDLAPGIQAREIFGKQLETAQKEYGLTAEQWATVKMPIEATINGKTMLFSSPENLAENLAQQGIYLKVK